MATPDRSSQPGEGSPKDLLPLIRAANILSDRLFDEVRGRVRAGDYPFDPTELARRLIREGILTEYQAKKLLSGKTAGLAVGKYVILDRLGSGSMGRVYKAQHSLMGRVVALKVIAPEIAANSRVISRFQREMRMVGRLDHPNVVRAYDADKLGGILYIVMEYVPGISLGVRLKTRGLLTAVEAAEYAGQAALGLAHAHEQGIVHRDVKPSNLLLSQEAQVKVLDLGLGVLLEADQHTSFATADGIAVGTIDYMSPEQATGKDVDGRSDLYSLGCTMYHLLTGRIPFPGDSPIDRLGKRLTSRPQPITDHKPEIPPKLVRVLDRLMATAPQDRYQTAAEAADALLALVKRRPAAGLSLSRSGIQPSPAGAAESVAPTGHPPVVGQAPPPEPEIVTIQPDYPAWFAPIARLAEERPTLALLSLIGTLGMVLSLGIALGALLL